MADTGITRRHFFFGTLLAGAIPTGGFGTVPSLKLLGYQSPNEKLNVAGIGAGGQPFGDLRQCETTENIVALADVDWERGAQGFERWEKAAKFKDFRQMLDKAGKTIDAVVIGTPDHMHTFAALWCMERGKGVYVEKPLTRIASEARLLARAAQKYKVATQMGNQGYSHEATRVACEIIWAGEIGEVREVHAWRGRPSWPQGMTKTPPATPIPSTLDWDLWLGTAAFRPFTAGDQEYRDVVAARSGRGRAAAAAPGGAPAGGGAAAAPGAGGMGGDEYGYYLPFNWRGFYDFGSSLIGDWGIHILGPANWALGLSPEHLISVECIKKDALPPTTFPNEFVLRFEFSPRWNMPPVTVYWYQQAGGDAFMPPGMTADQARQIPNTGPQIGPARAAGAGARAGAAAGARAAGGAPGAAARGAAGTQGAAGAPGAPRAGAAGAGRSGGGQQGSGYNLIFAGSKGYLGTSGRGEGVGLLPGARWADYTLPPQSLTRSPGHMRDWIRACKGGDAACSHFGVAGPYTEWLVLGAAAVRVEGKLLYDAKTGLFTNNKAANKYLELGYRKGWEVKLT